MTDAARLLLHVLTLVSGLAIGWGARGWNDGSTVTASYADASAQSAVQAGAGAAVSIDRAASVTDSAVERVRYITRTVSAAPECPPGAGPVSDALAAELREAVR